jgi:hypothetical protein
MIFISENWLNNDQRAVSTAGHVVRQSTENKKFCHISALKMRS